MTAVIEANGDGPAYRAPTPRGGASSRSTPRGRPRRRMPRQPTVVLTATLRIDDPRGPLYGTTDAVSWRFADEVAALHDDIRATAAPDQRAAIVGLSGCALASSLSRLDAGLSGRPRAATWFQSRPFARPDIPMTWDFVETNPFGADVGPSGVRRVNALRAPAFAPTRAGTVGHQRRSPCWRRIGQPMVATDPPYFGQIGYADISDYFYFWLDGRFDARFPDLFSTSGAKSGELVALPTRHGGSAHEARRTSSTASSRLSADRRACRRRGAHLVVYAYKEQNAKSARRRDRPRLGGHSRGDHRGGSNDRRDWPIHGTSSTRMISHGNERASDIVVLVCRPRPKERRASRVQTLPGCSVSEICSSSSVSCSTRISRRSTSPKPSSVPGMEVFTRHAASSRRTGSALVWRGARSHQPDARRGSRRTGRRPRP